MKSIFVSFLVSMVCVLVASIVSCRAGGSPQGFQEESSFQLPTSTSVASSPSSSITSSFPFASRHSDSTNSLDIGQEKNNLQLENEVHSSEEDEEEPVPFVQASGEHFQSNRPLPRVKRVYDLQSMEHIEDLGKRQRSSDMSRPLEFTTSLRDWFTIEDKEASLSHLRGSQ